MVKVRMLEVTRKGAFIGSLRLSDLVTAGGLLADRLRYEIAHMVANAGLGESVLRGTVTNYSDGSTSIAPRDAKGKHSCDPRGNLITLWIVPYDFDPETGERFKASGELTHTGYTKGV